MNEVSARGQQAEIALPKPIQILPIARHPERRLLASGSERSARFQSDSNLRNICEDVVRRLAEVAGRRGIDLEVAHFANDVQVDRDLLSHALFDLLYDQIDRAAAGSTLTLLTTPRPKITEIRIIDWRACEHVTVREQPQAKGGSLAGIEALKEYGGACSVEIWPGARAVCVRLSHAR